MRISDWSSDVCSSDLPDWRAISRVMRLPVALIMIRTFLERRQQRLHGFARDLDGARGGRIGLLKAQQVARSDERRVGKECVSTCRSRWGPDHYKTKQTIQINIKKKRHKPKIEG